MLNYEKLNEREDVTPNKHLGLTRVSMFIFAMITFAFACLAANVGCTSPPDNCSEVDKCDNGDDVDGSIPDQPDGSTNCATNGTCPDAGSDADAPPTATCAALAWMENPEMFDCVFFEEDGTEFQGNSCNPELITDSDGCQIKCLPMFWAVPEQLTVNEPMHNFEFRDPPNRIYPVYRCRQRLQ